MPRLNLAAYSEFFVRERNTPGSVLPGDLYEAIATNSQGNFIIRVREMMPKRQMTYDEALEDVIKATEENKAKLSPRPPSKVGSARSQKAPPRCSPPLKRTTTPSTALSR